MAPGMRPLQFLVGRESMRLIPRYVFRMFVSECLLDAVSCCSVGGQNVHYTSYPAAQLLLVGVLIYFIAVCLLMIMTVATTQSIRSIAGGKVWPLSALVSKACRCPVESCSRDIVA